MLGSIHSSIDRSTILDFQDINKQEFSIDIHIMRLKLKVE